MIANPPTMIVPMQEDERGAIYVSKTRVTLDSILALYQQGESPEQIHSSFSTVPLTDIYAVIAYYLAHTTEIDAYLKRRDEEHERVRQEIEANYTPQQRARTEEFKALLAKKRKEQAHANS